MDSLPLRRIIASTQGNFITQISWNTLLSSHLAFLAFFGFGIIGLESIEIGFSTPIIVLKEEALVVNKDLLQPYCNSRDEGNKIHILATKDLELEEGLMVTKKKSARTWNLQEVLVEQSKMTCKKTRWQFHKMWTKQQTKEFVKPKQFKLKGLGNSKT